MAPLYSVKPVHGGWLVFDVLTGHVLTMDGRQQTGLSLEQAEQLVGRLNYRAVFELVTSAANDPDEPDGEPR
jgi:hypothetical protein